MAGVPNGQVNIQDIVRAVVDNFNRLPPRSSPNPTGTASASTTTNEELNRCFQIPRSSQSFRPPCRAESQPNSQTAACTTTGTNDLSRRPQTLQSCQPQVTSQPTLSCSLSSGFSARTNYGAITLNSARATSRRRPGFSRIPVAQVKCPQNQKFITKQYVYFLRQRGTPSQEEKSKLTSSRKICVSMHGRSIKVGVRKILNLKLPNSFQRCWELTALN